MSPRWRMPYPVLAIALVLASALPSAAATAGRMTLDDVAALLKAGVGERVILARLDATGSRETLSPSVAEILTLKAAGASDDLLAALVGPPSKPSGDAEPGNPSFRIYREKNDNGEEVLHITNLDASGRRMGGEVPDHTQANVIRHDEAASSRGPEDRDAEAYDTAGRQAPVIVNIYPPEPVEPAPPDAGDYVVEPPFLPAVRYPGYAAGYVPGHFGGCRLRGGRHRAAFSPPGSYSHYLRYHHPDADAGLFSLPRAFVTAPYRLGDAAQRNRARFGHD